MPEFPRTSSRRALTTQQPAAFRQDADYRKDAAANTEITRRALEVATAIAIKWDDALVTSQLNSFKAQKGIILADIKSRASLDPDQNNAEIYLKELDDYSKKAFDGMSERAKNDASIELATDVEMAKIQVGGIFQKKVIAQAGLTLETGLEGSVKDILSTFNPAETQKKMFEAYAMIQRNVTNSIISFDDGVRRKEEFDEDVRIGLIDRDLYGDPAGFKKNAKSYDFKNEKEKSDKLATADKLIAKREAEIKQAEKIVFDGEESGLIEMMINKQDANGNPVSDVDLIMLAKTKMNDGRIRPSFAKTYIKGLESVKPKPSKLENIKVYNELVGKQVALKSKEFGWKEAAFEDRAQYRADVLEAWNKGNITVKEMENFTGKETKKYMNDPNVRNAIKQVTAQASLYDSPEAKAEVQAEMHFALVNKIIAGQDPNAALQDVIRERMISDLNKVSTKDEFGFTIGDERSGWIYEGNNQWRKKQ